MFQTKSGLQLPGIQSAVLRQLRSELCLEYGMTWTQIAEASSYSMAMVVRHALGLSALGARVATIVSDTPAGWIALATIRHLINAGSDAEIIFIGDTDSVSDEVQLQFKILDRMGMSVTLWNGETNDEEIATILENCHNCISGMYNLERAPNAFENRAVDLLNELNTPIYAVESPCGVDPDTGKSLGTPLYASCTLSLGAPLQGLFEGSEYVGRHYLCDISLTKELYEKAGMDLTPVFAEQPVQQIFPIKGEV